MGNFISVNDDLEAITHSCTISLDGCIAYKIINLGNVDVIIDGILILPPGSVFLGCAPDVKYKYMGYHILEFKKREPLFNFSSWIRPDKKILFTKRFTNKII